MRGVKNFDRHLYCSHREPLFFLTSSHHQVRRRPLRTQFTYHECHKFIYPPSTFIDNNNHQHITFQESYTNLRVNIKIALFRTLETKPYTVFNHFLRYLIDSKLINMSHQLLCSAKLCVGQLVTKLRISCNGSDDTEEHIYYLSRNLIKVSRHFKAKIILHLLLFLHSCISFKLYIHRIRPC